MSLEVWRVVTGLVVAVSAIIFLTRYIRVHAFFSLLLAGIVYGCIAGLPLAEIAQAIQVGFGTLLQQIGILVAFGTVLGMMLERSGAMTVISGAILHSFGARRTILAMTIVGMLIGIPVFCDSGFIILSKLIPALASKASVPATSLTLTLASGLYTTHTLVPPTPGPLAAASTLGAGQALGTVMILGLVTSIPVILVSYSFSRRMGPRISSLQIMSTPENRVKKISFLQAVLPVAVPVVLIAAASVVKMADSSSAVVNLIALLGTPVLALGIGLAFAVPLIDWKQNRSGEWVGSALKDAGVILLITGAGGAFGNVIRMSGIDGLLAQWTTGGFNTIFFFVFAWTIAAVLKTAQGSTTSALIITSSLVAPLAAASGLTSVTQLSLLTVCIGGGAMTLSHANDSFFWVVSQFGGLSAPDAFRSFSVLTLLQGVTVLITVCILSLLL